eukprot:SAG11_NODE_24499_length_372_cov_1.142857_1_plen_48_part_01
MADWQGEWVEGLTVGSHSLYLRPRSFVWFAIKLAVYHVSIGILLTLDR